MDKKKPAPVLVQGAQPSLKCGKCGGSMTPVPNNPSMKVCSGCGNRAGTVRLQ